MNQILPQSSTNPLFFAFEQYLASFGVFDIDNLPLSAFSDEFEKNRLSLEDIETANETFMGTDLFALSGGGCFPIEQRDQTLELRKGLNFFHFPSGEYINDSVDINYSLRLSESTLIDSGATPGSGVDNSDILWTIKGNEVSGAWLKSFSQELSNDTMCAKINSGRTIFRFPFPNRGLSGEGVGWDGAGIDGCRRNILVTENIEELEQRIEDLYWTEFPEISASEPISIHKTSLIDQGAFPSKNFFEADKITVRKSITDINPNGVYNGEVEKAWLYDFSHTQIPILPGNNQIYWPIYRLSNEESEDIPFQMRSDQSDPITLSSIDIERDMPGSVAGAIPEFADKIFKKQGTCGSRTEGAWLRSCSLNSLFPSFTEGSYQPSIAFKLTGGEEIRFPWMYPTKNANEVFGGLKHDSYCKYINQRHPSFLNNTIQNDETIDFSIWKTCDCHAVYYSPVGHNDPDKNRYKEFSDFVYRDFGYTEPFTFSNWRDDQGRDFSTSPHFAFANYDGIEPDVGWGEVVWKTVAGDDILLEKGNSYFYRRASLNSCGEVPDFISIASFCDNLEIGTECQPEWRTLKLDDSGGFVDGGEIANLEFFPTDIVEYERQETVSFRQTITNPNDQTNDIEYSYDTPASVLNTPLKTLPYWATSELSNGLFTHAYFDEPVEYLRTNQPRPSEIVLENNNYFVYNRESCEPFVWEQELDFIVNFGNKATWKILEPCYVDAEVLEKQNGCNGCSLSFEARDVISNDSLVLEGCELIRVPDVEVFSRECDSYVLSFIATDKDSDIVLETFDGCQDLTEVYYSAQTGFVWDQQLSSNTDLQFLPATTTDYYKAKRPWANLLNTNEVTIVQEPDDKDLRKREELGLFDGSTVGVQKILSRDRLGFPIENC